MRVSATLGERDRLASLLTETRTARAVIAGASPIAVDETPQAPALPRPAPGGMPVNRCHMNSPKLGERRDMFSSNSLALKMAAMACLDKREFLSDGLDFLIRDE